MRRIDLKALITLGCSCLRSLLQRLLQALSLHRGKGSVHIDSDQNPSQPRDPNRPHTERKSPKVTYVNWWKGSSHKPSDDTPQPHGAWGFAIMATAAVVVSTGYFVRYELKLANAGAIVATSASESRSKKLPDGSLVTLLAGSSMKLAYQPSERRVKLLEGAALFTAVPDSNRPFVVATHIAQASTTGATFKVAVDAGMVVEVYDGYVDVSVPGQPTITVRKGQRRHVIDESPRTALAHVRAQRAAVESMAHEDRSNSSARFDRNT